MCVDMEYFLGEVVICTCFLVAYFMTYFDQVLSNYGIL